MVLRVNKFWNGDMFNNDISRVFIVAAIAPRVHISENLGASLLFLFLGRSALSLPFLSPRSPLPRPFVQVLLVGGFPRTLLARPNDEIPIVPAGVQLVEPGMQGDKVDALKVAL